MATYTLTQIKNKVNTLLRDTADTTFTDAEKVEVITEIIENDPAFVTVARDTSLSTGTSTSTVSWTVPTQFEDIIDFGVDSDGDGIPEFLDRSAWDVVNGVIYLREAYYAALPSNKTIYLYGTKRLTTSDSIPDYLAKYAIELAVAELFEMLASALGTRFLKNDITMGELRNKIAAHLAKAGRYRAQMANRRIVTL